jgi:hypothetical protein
MAVNKKKQRAVLGGNPLNQGIFSKTTSDRAEESEEIKNQESTIKNQESRFLKKAEREAVNLRLPIEINDWLNDLLKQGKRKHGQKIPKEVWVQAALELFKAMPVDWAEIESVESLQEALEGLEQKLKEME